MKLFPAFLDLAGVPVLVVGGGAVALRRGRALERAGAQLTVVALDVHPELATLAGRVERRTFEVSDVRGARVVVAATSSAPVNDAVAAAARAEGAWVNHAGRASSGDLQVGLLVERGDVTLAVHTGRALPMLAQAVRDRLHAALPDHYPLDEWARRRDAALQLHGDPREAAMSALNADIRAWVGA